MAPWRAARRMMASHCSLPGRFCDQADLMFLASEARDESSSTSYSSHTIDVGRDSPVVVEVTHRWSSDESLPSSLHSRSECADGHSLHGVNGNLLCLRGSSQSSDDITQLIDLPLQQRSPRFIILCKIHRSFTFLCSTHRIRTQCHCVVWEECQRPAMVCS
jgi:hypothetical protein